MANDQLQAKTSNKTVALVFLLAAMCGAIVLLSGYVLLHQSHASIHDKLSVGMTVEDVRARLGEPDRQSLRGEPVDPPHTSGFTPHVTDHAYAYTYSTRSSFVYVLFDDRDRVMVYYVCGT